VTKLDSKSFIFSGLPTRVLFGVDHLAVVKAEAERLGMKQPMVVTGQNQSDLGLAISVALQASHWNGARMHTPVAITESALSFYNDRNSDGIISLGGGSAIGLGKAIALRMDCPQIAIPTSFAGSEMTNILGETTAAGKTAKRDAKIQPETVIYDPHLVETLPDSFAATSGMNAIAHAVEGLYAVDGNPIVSLMAEEGIRALAAALPKRDYQQALYGAWLCGTVLGSVSMALHHKLCHVLGGTFNLPHAETHTVVLPHATVYNSPAAPEAMQRIARALGSPSAAQGLFDLAKSLDAPTNLKELGMQESDLDKAADIAAANPYPNPQALTRGGIRTLLDDAYHGRRPTA
jgi:maleylacetate reductase